MLVAVRKRPDIQNINLHMGVKEAILTLQLEGFYISWEFKQTKV